MKVNLPVIIFILLFISLGSCHRNEVDPDCDSDNPLEDIPWLKAQKEYIEMSCKMSGGQIIRYIYHGNYVFLINTCYNCMDGLISVYDCNGEVICEFGGFAGVNTCPDFEAEATDSTMLFDFVQHK